MGILGEIFKGILPNKRMSKYALEEFEEKIRAYEKNHPKTRIDRRILEDFVDGKIGYDLKGIEKYKL